MPVSGGKLPGKRFGKGNEIIGAPGTGWQLDDEGDGINDSGDIIGKGTLNGVPALFYVAPK
jgi:hypothetical protein